MPNKIKLPNFANFFSKNAAYVGQIKNRKKLVRILLIAGFLFLPLIGFLFLRFRTIRLQTQEVNSYMEAIISRVESAKIQVEADPIAARSDLELSLAEIDALKKKFEKKPHAQKLITQQEDEIKSFFDSISGSEEFSKLDTFFDLRLLDSDSDFIASSCDISGDKAIFLDKDKGNLLELNLTTKEGKKLNLAQGFKAQAMSFNGEMTYLLGNGLREFNLATGETRELKAEGDSNREATLINYFADYIYVFNGEKRNIYRYSPGETQEYADPIGWLQDKQGLDFATVTGMQIDGDLWLSLNTGEILRYTRGEKADFKIRGLNDAFSSVIVLFTKENYKYLYVLEAEKNRLVILNKNGDFVKEIKSATLASATSLIVNQDETKAYAVSGSLLYEIDL